MIQAGIAQRSLPGVTLSGDVKAGVQTGCIDLTTPGTGIPACTIGIEAFSGNYRTRTVQQSGYAVVGILQNVVRRIHIGTGP